LISAWCQLRFAVDDIDQVVDDAPLAAHDQVEVAQPDVEVDDHRFVPALREAQAMRRLVVVLPTPPLPDVTTTTLATAASLALG
jgi:hypothetical protein